MAPPRQAAKLATVRAAARAWTGGALGATFETWRRSASTWRLARRALQSVLALNLANAVGHWKDEHRTIARRQATGKDARRLLRRLRLRPAWAVVLEAGTRRARARQVRRLHDLPCSPVSSHDLP